MINCETKLVKFDVRFYNGMCLQEVELPKNIELTLVYETDEHENKYIGIGKHIDDAEYWCHRLSVIRFGEYDLFIFDKSYLRDEYVRLVDFDEFNKKWSQIFNKFYFHEMFIDSDITYACAYRQETTKIANFIKFNKDCGDEIIKVACLGFKSPEHIDVSDDSMIIINIDPFSFMNYPSEKIHCVTSPDEIVKIKYLKRFKELENKFETYEEEPNDGQFHHGQIITDGKTVGIFDKYSRSVLDGKINSFFYYNIKTIDKQSVVSGNNVNDWRLGCKADCHAVFDFLAENDIYYNPHTGKLEDCKNDD